MNIVTTGVVLQPGKSIRDLLIFDLAMREARRRSKRRNPPARYLIEVLDELGLRLTVAP